MVLCKQSGTYRVLLKTMGRVRAGSELLLDYGELYKGFWNQRNEEGHGRDEGDTESDDSNDEADSGNGCDCHVDKCDP